MLCFRAMLLFSLTVLPMEAGVEVLTPRFRIVTRMPAETALRAADDLERAHASLKNLGVHAPAVGYEPIPVLLVQDRAQLEALFPTPISIPGLARGFFRPGVDRDYIVLSWDPPETVRIALAHEYVHWIFQDQDEPLWYREGLAEYFSHSIGLKNGAVFGSPVALFLQRLQNEEWISLPRLLSAKREAEMIAHPTFYAQCWLIMHWYASKVGAAALPRYEDLERQLASEGEASLETRLREHLDRLVAKAPAATTVSFVPLDRASFAVRSLDEWEWSYYLGDVWREAQSWETAEGELRRLEKDYPQRPEPSETLGALLMDRYDYAGAEKTLARAITKGSSNPRTHHRYALTLLRPVERGAETARRRATLARDHAAKALDREPGEPSYMLTHAQALGLIGEWEPAAERLAHLAAHPGFRERASDEFDVLMMRQRGHAMRIPQPRIEHQEAALDLAFLQTDPEPIALPPLPPKQPLVWPPPGTILMYGHIVKVECGAGGKVVTVQTPRWRMRLREPAGAPAELHSPPKGWRPLPCDVNSWDAAGREVNVVYKPIFKDGDARGELVAVVF